MLDPTPLTSYFALLVDDRVSGALDYDKHAAALAALLAPRLAGGPGRRPSADIEGPPRAESLDGQEFFCAGNRAKQNGESQQWSCR